MQLYIMHQNSYFSNAIDCKAIQTWVNAHQQKLLHGNAIYW